MKIYIASILFLFSSCGDDSNIPVKSLDQGIFEGNIGRHLFVQENAGHRNVITQKGNYSNLDIEIKLDGSGGQDDNKFFIYNQLDIHLTNISKDKSYFDFGVNDDANSLNRNKINLFVKEQVNSSIKSENYACIPDKKQFNITITDLGDSNNIFVKGNINGYLFNVNNPKDSILIAAKFTTH